MSNCRSCGAKIIWIATKTGKKMPVNWDQEIETETEFDPERMESHFATCKQADEWRKP